MFLAPDLITISGYAEFKKELGNYKVSNMQNAEICIVVPSIKYRALRNKTVIYLCNPKELKTIEEQGKIASLHFKDILEYLQRKPLQVSGNYLLSGYSCERITLHSIFKGWDNLADDKDYMKIDYLHIDPSDGRRDKNLYSVRCRVKNSLVAEILDLVTDKSQLYKNMKKYIPETEELNTFQYKKGIYIAKPAGTQARAGSGITIVKSRADLMDAKKIINNNPHWKGIISKYIDPPLLFKQRKFHLRVYMLVTSQNNYSIFLRSHIFTSAGKYVKGDYSKSVSDTHGESTEEDWEFPLDWEGGGKERMLQDVENICAEIWKVLDGKIEKYPESDYGYELIAPDIMFDENYTPWLLEVNRRVGLTPLRYTKRYSSWTQDFWNWIFAEGIYPGLREDPAKLP